MSTREEKCLGVRAHEQIGICCESLCDSSTVKEYIEQLEEMVTELSHKVHYLERKLQNEET